MPDKAPASVEMGLRGRSSHDTEHSGGYARPDDPDEAGPRIIERPSVGVLNDGIAEYLRRTLQEVVFGTKMNLLLVTFPLALLSAALGWGDAPTFIFALIALCPLAERIAFVTEDLAKCTNETIGGLMNASMGNITELIVSTVALKEGMLRVVQVSLIGSIYSNLLLVLGCAFFIGGIKHPTLRFNRSAANANSGVLLLATMALCLPDVLDMSHDEWDGTLKLSRGCSVIMLFLYGALVFYQLKTHRHLFEGGTPDAASPPASPAAGVRQGGQVHSGSDDDEDDDDEGPSILGFWGATAWLSVITVMISVVSEMIVKTIEGAASDMGMPILFIGTILLPIVGNAAEHAAAVIFAWKKKPDLALGICVGSASQIALFVIPLCVVMGWIIGQPMSLDFHTFETASVLLTVIIVAVLITSGEGDWLRGVMLLAAYLFLSIGFWVHKDMETPAPGAPNQTIFKNSSMVTFPPFEAGSVQTDRLTG